MQHIAQPISAQLNPKSKYIGTRQNCRGAIGICSVNIGGVAQTVKFLHGSESTPDFQSCSATVMIRGGKELDSLRH